MLHIEGMGVLGSALAWRLDSLGAPFTWHDAAHAFAAWPASTGSIYPSGIASDQACYQLWDAWYHMPPWRGKVEAQLIEPADYWYSSKATPHGGPWRASRDEGALRLHALPSYHVNVQSFVSATRGAFEGQRRTEPPAGALVVEAHGNNARLVRYTWGWSAPIELEVSERIRGALRPCIYVASGRYRFAYAYPKPGTRFWYAGSSMIAQRPDKARELTTAPKYQAWRELFLASCDGLVKRVEIVGAAAQGWRPIGDAADTELAIWHQGRILVRPCGSLGVTRAPAVAEAVLALVKNR